MISSTNMLPNAPTSLRSCFSKQSYSQLRKQFLLTKFLASQNGTSVARCASAYTPPSRFNLLGRWMVACSGVAERRVRACARLNNFLQVAYTIEDQEQLADAKQVALSKFKKSFADCKTDEQRDGMMDALSNAALNALCRGEKSAELKVALRKQMNIRRSEDVPG